MQIEHRKQQTDYSCAAACFAMVTGISEERSRQLCQTKKSGTSMENVQEAFKKLDNKLSHHVTLNLPIEECWFLANFKFPTILHGIYLTKYCKRGRPRKTHHAVVLNQGIVYDPASKREFPLEAYFSKFDKLKIKSMIIVENI